MGVWKLGQYGLEVDRKQNYSKYLPNWTKEDVIGSPYAVYEYECNPSIGNNGDLSWLKSEINKRGMKLMHDFVPNHLVVDAPKTKENPEMYIRSLEGQEIDENKYTFGNSLILVKAVEYFLWNIELFCQIMLYY